MRSEICAFNQRCHFLWCGYINSYELDLGNNKRVPERYCQAVLSPGKDPVKSVNVPGQKSD